jgi:hypothetical protein
MNRLVIIGNGFDLAHGLKTSYKDFIDWYWEQRLKDMLTEHSDVSSDSLCTFKIIAEDNFGWHSVVSDKEYYDIFNRKWKFPAINIIKGIANNEEDFYVELCPFFNNITKSIDTKSWVDIENEYYKLLKKYADKPDECKELNKQLKYLQDKLVEYLMTQDHATKIETIDKLIYDKFYLEDFCVSMKSLDYDDPGNVVIINFNYTNTAWLYNNGKNALIYNIHGSLKSPEEIIFGYGDELDKNYQDILDKNDNELLRYMKNVKYLEAANYKIILQIIETIPFQVYIMGHSCGNSDRTLLNTIFEHKNCVSIKPFYYKKPDGTDTYLEIVQNISRNFTDMKLFRDRVVNKTRCISLQQSQEQ